jgi:hypothetical protein
MTQSTIQSGGPINGADAITIELIQSDSMPAVVRIVWPTAATITTPARYLEVAAAMKVLAESLHHAGQERAGEVAGHGRRYRQGLVHCPDRVRRATRPPSMTRRLKVHA